MPPRIAPGRGRGTSTRGGGPMRGGAAGRGGAVATTAPYAPPTVGVARPGFGTGGKLVNTTVNVFATEVSNELLHHYDTIQPDTLPSRANMELFTSLQREVAPGIFSNGASYDGRKNAYTNFELQLGPSDSATFDVPMARPGPPAAGIEAKPSSEKKPPKVYKIKVTKVATINTEILKQFIAGKHAYDSAVSTALTAFNVALRMEPNMKYPFNSRSFFTPAEKKPIGKGLELWRGYFQSLRPTAGGMITNIDISTGIMYAPGPLIPLFLQYMEQRDHAQLTSTYIPERQRLILNRFFTGLRVTTKHTGREQTRTIKRVTNKSANDIMFQTREGQSMSVANYFKNVLGRPLRFPHYICLEVGTSGAFIPIELCEVPPGQMMRKQIPDDKTTDIVAFSQRNPTDRLASIKQGLNVLQYGQSEYVRKFGIKISPTPLTVKARVLATPVLKYGDSSKEKTIRPANGQWNMRDKKFFTPAVIGKWIVVVFDHRWSKADADEMVKSFVEAAHSVGMKFQDSNPMLFNHSPHDDIAARLRNDGLACVAAKKGPPNLVVVVLPEGGNEVYTKVKNFGDVVVGVTTQCLKGSKCKRANMQYFANVMLKLNVKLGGINNILADNQLLNDPRNPTIVMGADVIHPAPGAEGRPSFTALVSSLDCTTAKYIATSRVQTGRQEIIEDLEPMVKNSLEKYNAYRAVYEKGRPACARLIFFRDGVSEGQFQHVLDEELPKIKSACAEMKIKPKITLIVVGKRHHIRMFPTQHQDADKSGNCQAGTTIDAGLGHPTEFDYYQLTHGGLLGTSRPAHYSVLYDENGFNADTMQNLSFALCHVYARATRSVSIPAPVYYADIVCARAKNHFDPGHTILDEFEGTPTLEAFKDAYQPLHKNMRSLMYFM